MPNAAADILDNPSGIRGSLGWSFGVHAALFGAILATALLKGPKSMMGDPDPMGGAIGIDTVSAIPIPQSSGNRNPLADQTPAETPRDTEKQDKEQKDRDKALEKLLSKDLANADKPKNTFKEKKELARNQLTTDESRVSSPLFSVAGSGGIGAKSSTLGNQFGAYMEAVQQRISSKWRPVDVDSRVKSAPICIVQFDILRDGRMENLKVVQSSGNITLDLSAQRAINEANPFEPLPAGFAKSSANLEVAFKLQR